MRRWRARPRRRERPSDLAPLADRTVERALALGADAAEAFAFGGSGGSVEIEGGRVTVAERGEGLGVGVRVLRRGRLGFAHFTDEADLDAAVRSAIEALRVLPRKDFAFPGRRALPTVARIHDRRLAVWTPEEAVEACRTMLDAARAEAPGGLVTGGGVGWGEEEVALANSEGFRGAWRGTDVGASAEVVLRGASTATGFETASSRRLDLDVGEVGRRAAALAKAQRRPRKAPEGALPVVLRPTALEGLFESLVLAAVTGEAARAKRSVYAGKVGTEVMPRGVSLVEDGRMPGGPNSAPFDDEGTPARPVPIVEKGVLRGFLEDVAGARAAGGRPTSSAMRASRMGGERTHEAPPRATGRNLVLAGRGVPLEDLVRDVRRGLVVHDALGAHTANSASGAFSVGASVAFVVEDGEIAGAARPVMLSGNLPEALRTVRLGNDRRPLGGAFTSAAMLLPSVRLEGVRVVP